MTDFCWLILLADKISQLSRSSDIRLGEGDGHLDVRRAAGGCSVFEWRWSHVPRREIVSWLQSPTDTSEHHTQRTCDQPCVPRLETCR